jgi:hypothetical protein
LAGLTLIKLVLQVDGEVDEENSIAVANVTEEVNASQFRLFSIPKANGVYNGLKIVCALILGSIVESESQITSKKI